MGLWRSTRKKGPEPEGIVLGNIGDNTYAFVGLERFGGIAVFDVTLPMNPQFVEFFNDRDYSAETDSAKVLTQLGPEGLVFVPANESPNGENLLIVSYEVSGNTVVYKINERLAAQTDLYTWDSPTGYSEKEMFYFNETDSTLSDVTMIEGGWSDLVIDPFVKIAFGLLTIEE